MANLGSKGSLSISLAARGIAAATVTATLSSEWSAQEPLNKKGRPNREKSGGR